MDHDAVIEKLLRTEVRQDGQRWVNEFKRMHDDERVRLLGILMARRAIREARNKAMSEKHEPDENETRGGCGTLQHGTGGGHRVILKGSPFS